MDESTTNQNPGTDAPQGPTDAGINNISAATYPGATATDLVPGLSAAATKLLALARELVGESDQGDLTPTLVEEVIQSAKISLRDQTTGRAIALDTGDVGQLLRQAMAAGACVDMPQPGDIVVFQYNTSRLYWSGIVNSVAATDLDMYASLPFREQGENEYQIMTVSRRGVNAAWRTVGFIRL